MKILRLVLGLALLAGALIAVSAESSTATSVARTATASPRQAVTPAAPRVSEINNAASSCQDIAWIGARGSGEASNAAELNMGRPVHEAFKAYIAKDTKHRIGYYTFPFAAQDVKVLATASSNLFFEGLSNGVDQVMDFIKIRHQRCPFERVILAGYSQGAMVMHRVIWQIDKYQTTQHGELLSKRVVAVLAIADGDRVPKQGGIEYGTQRSSSSPLDWGIGTLLRGFDTGRFQPRTAALPPWAAKVYRSVCDENDLVCDSLRSIGATQIADYSPIWWRTVIIKLVRIGVGLSIHGEHYRPGGGVRNAVDAIAESTKNLRFTSVLKITPPTIAPVLGQPFSYELHTTGGQAPYTWTVVKGQLPPGLSLSGQTVSGTPTTQGEFTFTLQVKDRDGQYDRAVTAVTLSDPPQGSGGWKTIDTGGSHSCGIKSDSTLWCWGYNYAGGLGVGDTTNRNVPTQVGADSWKAVTAGEFHSCGVKSDDTLWCWGYDYNGQLGVGDTTNRNVPTQVGADTWKAVTAGRSHSCGVKSDDTLWCWGYNYSGELGVGDTTSRHVPTQVGAGAWKMVTAGGSHSCGVRPDDTLWCWGYNYYGQLGSGDIISRHVPTRVGTGAWKMVTAGVFHSCGVRSDDTVWCWGYNYNGELGVGDTTDRNIPTQVGTSVWRAISAGNSASCGVKSDGTLWCWGFNYYGELGVGDTANRIVPTRVGTSIWRTISAGGWYSCATKADDTVWCWGYNFAGQLGVGDTTNRDTPTAVGG